MNSLERKIRVDQSHCNYHLSLHLGENGWQILFRDPGRVSRGFSGSQEVLLGLFERNGLPIPDVVCLKEGDLLLIEVDKSIRNNIASMVSYHQSEALILHELSLAGYECNQLVIGFCKVGIATASERAAVLGVDGVLLADFPHPFPPRLEWFES